MTEPRKEAERNRSASNKSGRSSVSTQSSRLSTRTNTSTSEQTALQTQIRESIVAASRTAPQQRPAAPQEFPARGRSQPPKPQRNDASGTRLAQDNSNPPSSDLSSWPSTASDITEPFPAFDVNYNREEALLPSHRVPHIVDICFYPLANTKIRTLYTTAYDAEGKTVQPTIALYIDDPNSCKNLKARCR